MKVLFVNEAGVRKMLPMRACIERMREVLSTFSRGDAVLPLREKMWLPDRSGLLGVMPGYLGSPRSFGLKVVSVMPGNHGTPYDSHQGVVMLFGLTHGEPLAIMDAASITEIRTAAASAVATDVLARKDAKDLAILGSGTQARSHLEAMNAVRTLRRVRVWSRSTGNARRLVEHARTQIAGPTIEVVETAEAAVREADIICTTTSAKEPVLRGEWLAPGAHVNAVGSCFPAAQEIDGDAVLRSRLFTDCRESCEQEAGDFLVPLRDGMIEPAHLRGELGAVLNGELAGRVSDEDITIYESLGIALEDLAAAHEIHRRAGDSGSGTWLEWGGPA